MSHRALRNAAREASVAMKSGARNRWVTAP